MPSKLADISGSGVRVGPRYNAGKVRSGPREGVQI